MKIELEINKGRIADLFCSAVESSYGREWLELTKTKSPTNGISKEELATVNDWENGQYCYIYPLFGDGYLLFTEIYEKPYKKYYLDYKMIEKGLKVFAEKSPYQFGEWLLDNDDSITGDVFLQCCLFGEVKYG